MAKIRGIKPEFWTDEAIVELSPLARLLFIGMWNFACDNGHLADKPRQIKMRILPADDGVDVAALLEELTVCGRIERAAGTITIHRFAYHQKPHKHWWTTCDLPGCEPPEGAVQQVRNRRTTGAQPLDNGGPTADVEVDGDGELMVSSAAPRRRSPEHPLPEDWQPTEAHRTYATGHRVDIDREVFKFRNHAAAKDRRQRNWNAAFSTWLARAEEYAPARVPERTDLPEAWR